MGPTIETEEGEQRMKALFSLAKSVRFTKPETNETIPEYETRQLKIIANSLGAGDFTTVDSYYQIKDMSGVADLKVPIVIRDNENDGSFLLIVPYFEGQGKQLERFAIFQITSNDFSPLELDLIQLAIDGVSGNLFSYQALEDHFAVRSSEFTHNLHQVTTHLRHFSATSVSQITTAAYIGNQKIKKLKSPTITTDEAVAIAEDLERRFSGIDTNARFISRVSESSNEYLNLLSGITQPRLKEEYASEIVKSINTILTGRYKSELGSGDIDFIIDDSLSDSQTLRLDISLLTDALGHIINNGFDFHKSGEKSHVSIRMLSVDGKIVIEIEDNGIGIDEASLPRLFEPFFQESKAGTIFNYGTGFGVGIKSAKILLDLIGAGIDVRSTKGVGTTVRITLN